jgi:hypothetical protein
VRGDDLLPRMAELLAANQLTHFETGEPIKDASAFLTANAYFGGWGIADALARGADIVITGRVTDCGGRVRTRRVAPRLVAHRLGRARGRVARAT